MTVEPVPPHALSPWDEVTVTDHYLGFRILVGESLEYVAEPGDNWPAPRDWGAAAFKCGPRDAWIGWTTTQQWSRLRYIANNSRFLILPGERRPNLASWVLGANPWRLSGISRQSSGTRSCTWELSWTPTSRVLASATRSQELGNPPGYRRNRGRHPFHGSSKAILARARESMGREWLRAPFGAPASPSGGRSSPDPNYFPDSKGELLELLTPVPDRLERKGIRHRQANVLMVATCATLAGKRSVAAIAELAAPLPQEPLERRGCCGHPEQGYSLLPSEPTAWRTLQTVDVNLVDRELDGFRPHHSMGIRIPGDGNAERCAVGKGGQEVRLLGAVAHNQAVVIGQRQVGGKQTEVTESLPRRHFCSFTSPRSSTSANDRG